MAKSYGEFIDKLIEARDFVKQAGAVYEILNIDESNICVSGEDAKAFLIHLAIDTLGIDQRSDMVLASWGLLRDYNLLQSVTDRRIKFLTESNYKGKKTSLKAEVDSGNTRSLEDRTKDIGTQEIAYYGIIEKKYKSFIIDKIVFFQAAKQKYLARSVKGNGDYRVKLPLPSYLSGTPMPLNNLPQRKPMFLGRTDILETIENNFANNQRIQLLVGIGGVGKTRIALEYTYLHTKNYEAIAWVNAQSITSISESCSNFLKKIETGVVDLDADTVREDFISFFDQSSDWLIIYDNADYLDEDSEKTKQMREMLEQCLPSSDGDILITTRCNKPFLGVDGISVDVFPLELSLRYLEKQTGQKADAAAKLLAKKLGNLPLALEYVAAYIKASHKTYQQYLDLWDHEGVAVFDENILETTIRKAFHITLDKLSEKTQGISVILQFLNFCAILAGEYVPIAFFNNDFNERDDFGTFSEELIAILNNELRRDRLLRKTSEYSLIEYIDGDRISMHPMLREIIEDELQRDRDSNDPKKQIEALRWKRIGYRVKSELAYALYEGGDRDAAIKQMRFVIPHFLEMEYELLQLKGKVGLEKSIDTISLLGVWDDARREFDRIYWRTMRFADNDLKKELLDTRRKLMDAYYSVGLRTKDNPAIYDYLFVIELSKNGHTFALYLDAPHLLNNAEREQGCVFAVTAVPGEAKQEECDVTVMMDKYHKLSDGDEAKKAVARLIQICALYGTGGVPRVFLYAALEDTFNNASVDMLISDASDMGLLTCDDVMVYMDISLQELIYVETGETIKKSWSSTLLALFSFFINHPAYQYIITDYSIGASKKKGGTIYYAVKDKWNTTHYYEAKIGNNYLALPWGHISY